MLLKSKIGMFYWKHFLRLDGAIVIYYNRNPADDKNAENLHKEKLHFSYHMAGKIAS